MMLYTENTRKGQILHIYGAILSHYLSDVFVFPFESVGTYVIRQPSMLIIFLR